MTVRRVQIADAAAQRLRVHVEGTSEWGIPVNLRPCEEPGWEGYGTEFQLEEELPDAIWYLTGPDNLVPTEAPEPAPEPRPEAG